MDACLHLALLEALLPYDEVKALSKRPRRDADDKVLIERDLPTEERSIYSLNWTWRSKLLAKAPEKASEILLLDGIERFPSIETLYLASSDLASIRPIIGLPALELVYVKVSRDVDLQPLLLCPKLKRVHIEFDGASNPAHEEVLDTLFERGVQIDGMNGPGSGEILFDDMLLLAVLNQLHGRKLVSLPEAHFFDEYHLDDDNFDRLRGVPLTLEILDTIEELSWSGGGYSIQHMVWSAWDGESDEFDMNSLEGHQFLRNLKALHVSPMTGLPEDELEDLRARGVTVDEDA